MIPKQNYIKPAQAKHSGRIMHITDNKINHRGQCMVILNRITITITIKTMGITTNMIINMIIIIAIKIRISNIYLGLIYLSIDKIISINLLLMRDKIKLKRNSSRRDSETILVRGLLQPQ